MKVEEKQSIIQAAQAYMEEKGISQNELSKLTGVNVSYLSSMMKGVFTFINSRTGKESDIDDKWFLALAGRIGHKVAKVLAISRDRAVYRHRQGTDRGERDRHHPHHRGRNGVRQELHGRAFPAGLSARNLRRHLQPE